MPENFHDEATPAIRALARFMNDLRPMWPLITALHQHWMSEQFKSEGGFAGERWQPLSPGYAEWKDKHYPGRGILVATGAMRSATQNPRRDALPLSLTLTVTDEKIGYHQDGTDRMPARPVLFGDPLPPGAEEELRGVVEGYVDEIVAKLRV